METNMNYSEMLNSPFTAFTTSAGVVACSRELAQLPNVLEAIGGRGVLLGRPKTWSRIVEKYGDIFARDEEGGPSDLLWRSVIPTRRKYERVKSLNLRPIRWPDVPGSRVLWELLTEDEIRYLKFTLNCQKWFTKVESRYPRNTRRSQRLFKIGDIKSDGFAAYSTALVAILGDNL